MMGGGVRSSNFTGDLDHSAALTSEEEEREQKPPTCPRNDGGGEKSNYTCKISRIQALEGQKLMM